jgi:hypothetical protein
VRIILKRNILFILMILGLAAMVQAQMWGPGWNRRNTPANETITVSGTMVVANGMPALKSGDVTYYISGISRLIGFIDGLKEGAQVTIEGVATSSSSNRNIKLLRASKLTINGKTYELSSPELSLPSPPAFSQNPGDPRLYQYRLPGPMGHMMTPNTPNTPRTPRRR